MTVAWSTPKRKMFVSRKYINRTAIVQNSFVRKWTWPFGCDTAGIRVVSGFSPYSFEPEPV